MINTTMAYKKAIEKNRYFRIRDTIFFDDGKQITLSMEDVTAYSINGATSSDGKFEIGAAIVKEYKASLNNMDGKFDDIGFEGADISAKIGLRLQDGSWEDLRKGEFRIIEAKARELTVDIRAYDGMLFFDRPYSESVLAYPASINQIIADACLICQMTFNARTVQMGNYVIRQRPDDKAITFRDIISYCAQIMGCYAYINNLGQLEFGWYDFDALKFLRNGRYDGGRFDPNIPYASGDTADGGKFLQWDAGEVLDGGEFTDTDAYHHVYLLKTKSINTDDITVTGVSILTKKDSGEEERLLYGKEGYVLELSDNPLIQENVQQVLQHVGAKVTGNTFRPMNITTQSDPSMEAGDLVIVTDRKQRSYWTVITNTTFSLSGSQKIECSAETPAEKNYTRYGAVTKLVSATKEDSDQKLSSYEITSRQFSELMARSMGLYTTYEEQEDGSTIKYQHDKPLLSESKTIWKQSQNAFGVSTDGGKTWNAGTDAEGNALYNVLSAVGFYFDWANGGTLTLGGYNNTDGVEVILDSNGNECGRMDKDGILMMKHLGLLPNGKRSGYYAGIQSMEFDAGMRKSERYGFTVSHPHVYDIDPYSDNSPPWGEISIAPCGHIQSGMEYDGGIQSISKGKFVIQHSTKMGLGFNKAVLGMQCNGSNRNDIRIGFEKTIQSQGSSNQYTGLFSGISIGLSSDDVLSAELPGVGFKRKRNAGSEIFYPETTFAYGSYIYGSLNKECITTETPNLWWRAGSYFQTNRSMCVTSSSSQRYKDIERKMNLEDVEKLYNICPVMAKYKKEYLAEGDSRFNKVYPMFIAENVFDYFPHAIDRNESGQIETWNERVMIPAMFQMIKSQKDIIDSQSEKIDILSKRLEKLEALLLKGGD